MTRPEVVSEFTDNEPGQLAPPVLVQVKVVQFKPALGISLMMALFAHAGHALLAVMV